MNYEVAFLNIKPYSNMLLPVRSGTSSVFSCANDNTAVSVHSVFSSFKQPRNMLESKSTDVLYVVACFYPAKSLVSLYRDIKS